MGGRDVLKGREIGMWYTNETETDADKLEMWSSRTEHWVLHSFIYIFEYPDSTKYLGKFPVLLATQQLQRDAYSLSMVATETVMTTHQQRHAIRCCIVAMEPSGEVACFESSAVSH